MLILASTSATRAKMLRDVGINVQCEPSGVDESAVSEAAPDRLAARLALAKAEAVAARFPGRLVLGADQVAFDGAECFGKPLNPDDHLRRLQALRGRTHWLHTAFALVGPQGTRVGVVQNALQMRPDLDDNELRAYVACGEGAGCAGGYAAEGRGAWLFARVDGDWFSVMGLPIFEVLGALRALGWPPGGQP